MLREFENPLCHRWQAFARTLLIGLCTALQPALADDANDAFAVGNFQKALEIWLPRAYDGDAQAQYRLGLMFDAGTGITEDAGEAVYWLTHAAELGHAGAQYRIGHAHLTGRGVPKDRNRAIGWWRLAAGNGNADAQYSLGRSYLYGAGLASDRAAAIRWLEAAADQQHVQAVRLLTSLDNAPAVIAAGSSHSYFRVGTTPLHVHVAFNRLSPIIDRLAPGVLLQVEERRLGWARVRVGGGFRLWLRTENLAGDDQAGWKTRERTKLFAEPVSTDPLLVLGEVESGMPLVAVDRRDGWMRINAPSRISGWVEALGLVSATEASDVLQAEWRKQVDKGAVRRSDAVSTGKSPHSPATTTQSNQAAAPSEADSMVSLGTQGRPTDTSVAVVEPLATDKRSNRDQSSAPPAIPLRPLQLETHDWLFSWDPSHYTVELFSATSEVLVRQFIRAYRFDDPVKYFRTHEHGKVWYTVVHGTYVDVTAVRTALQQLPVKFETVRIRRLGELREWFCQHLDPQPSSTARATQARCISANDA